MAPPDAAATPERMANARRAAESALRSHAERRLISAELAALEHYVDSWARHAQQLERSLNPLAQPPRDGGTAASDDALATAPKPMQVGAAPLVVRSAHELSSSKVCELAAGHRVNVLEVRRDADGRCRARVSFSASTWLSSGVAREGWVTATLADGTESLVAPTWIAASGGASSAPAMSAEERQARASCATTAAMLKSALGSEWQWHEERAGAIGALPVSWLKQIELGVRGLSAAASRERGLRMALAAERVRADAAEALADERLRQLRHAGDEAVYAEARETSLRVRVRAREAVVERAARACMHVCARASSCGWHVDGMCMACMQVRELEEEVAFLERDATEYDSDGGADADGGSGRASNRASFAEGAYQAFPNNAGAAEREGGGGGGGAGAPAADVD